MANNVHYAAHFIMKLSTMLVAIIQFSNKSFSCEFVCDIYHYPLEGRHARA